MNVINIIRGKGAKLKPSRFDYWQRHSASSTDQ
jgi:hypothetical protein